MHSEDMSMQEKSVECFSNLAKEFATSESIAKMVSGSFEYAMKHYEIVKRFGLSNSFYNFFSSSFSLF